jgi:hypothetical protein
VNIQDLRRQVEDGRRTLAELEAQLHRAEQQARDERWFPQGFYTAYYVLSGMVLGVIASWATLLFHIAGAWAVGEPALKLLRVYSTILGGARTAESSEAVILVFALGIHTLTGAVCGAPLHVVYSRFFMGQGLKLRLLSGLWLGVIMWLVNFYGILWWLQPLLLGESRSSIVDTIPVWLAALTHIAFTEIMLLLQPLAVFNARSYPAAPAVDPSAPGAS